GNNGFPARIEAVNALEAWLGSLPGHGYQNVRRAPLHTLNLADLLPLTSVWPGRETSPCPFYPPESPPLLVAATAGSTPFRLNLHVGDVGHTLIIGPTGAGKSSLVGLIMAQFFRYPNAQVFCFDKGYSSFPLCQAAGGEHYDVAGETETLGLCPLAHIVREGERGWAADWLETLFGVQGVKVTPRHREAITTALRNLAWDKSHSLTDLKNTLQDEDLRRALDPYTLTGPLGGLLDATSDDLGRGRFQVFELEHLMNRGEAQTVPVLTYLFHAIERRLDGRPTLIVLEEAWIMLMHSLFAERVEEWLRVLRKRNAAVVFVTQSLADIAKHPKRDLILQSCPTKIFLPNPEAGTDLQAHAYREIGLTDRQIEVLSYAIPKRDYLVTSTEGRRLINLDLGPVALAFVGASGKDDISRCRRLISEYADEWPAAWLESRNLFDAARQWRSLNSKSVENLYVAA
ncbi:MAG: hypothetical protein M3Z21_09325, partial [Pseudomonadota bacterium]|nr:hypothetical protein [Pseudomonadota bacterium]